MSDNYEADETGAIHFKERYDVAAELEATANDELRISLRDTVSGHEMVWFPNRYDLLEAVMRLCVNASEAGS